mgnify:CR=1 FL=1
MLRPVTVTPASPRPARAWDIVLFGATGFAGRLVAPFNWNGSQPTLSGSLAQTIDRKSVV